MKTPLVCLFLSSVVLVCAGVKPAALFADHVVLQRGKPVVVWGTADAGERVSASFADHMVETIADVEGRWRVELPSMIASMEPRELVIRGKNVVTISDVLVGEVWLASGQSNMERPMRLTFDTAMEYPASVDYPMIREFKVSRIMSEQSVVDVTGSWRVAGPETLPEMSAVAYYFARDLYGVLRVPVGIINSTWGGTPGETWIDEASLKASAVNDAVQQRWRETLANYPAALAKYNAAKARWAKRRDSGDRDAKFTLKAPTGPGHHYTPSGLFNSMIAPLTSATIRGVIWYQGENNARAPRDREYRELFPALITGWRRAFCQGDIPFYWAQISSFSAGNVFDLEWPNVREGQTLALKLPNTGQAVTIDIGNASDIHPKEKHIVGRRLARIALHRTYGLDIKDSGPVFAQADREGAGYRLKFSNAESGLVAPLVELSGFELAGEDKVFHSAMAKIDGDSVVVTCSVVTAPVAVRYAWHNAVAPGLFNDEGLPAVPFRTDSW